MCQRAIIKWNVFDSHLPNKTLNEGNFRSDITKRRKTFFIIRLLILSAFSGLFIDYAKFEASAGQTESHVSRNCALSPHQVCLPMCQYPLMSPAQPPQLWLPISLGGSRVSRSEARNENSQLIGGAKKRIYVMKWPQDIQSPRQNFARMSILTPVGTFLSSIESILIQDIKPVEPLHLLFWLSASFFFRCKNE